MLYRRSYDSASVLLDKFHQSAFEGQCAWDEVNICFTVEAALKIQIRSVTIRNPSLTHNATYTNHTLG